MSYSGVYRGFRFRSLMEVSFMKHMEEQGLVLGETLLYEHLAVPYLDKRGKRRKYIVDFYSPSTNEAWEVKPSRRRFLGRNMTKAQAAVVDLSARGIRYRVVDEKEFRVYTVKELACDPDISFTPKSQRKINSVMKRLAKKSRKGKK